MPRIQAAGVAIYDCNKGRAGFVVSMVKAGEWANWARGIVPWSNGAPLNSRRFAEFLEISAMAGIARSSSGSWTSIETNKATRPGIEQGLIIRADLYVCCVRQKMESSAMISDGTQWVLARFGS